MRAPIIGLVCALVALAPLIWRPDLPLLYVTVFMGRLPSQRCRRQSRCGRGHETQQDSLMMRPRDKASLTMRAHRAVETATQIRQTILEIDFALAAT